MAVKKSRTFPGFVLHHITGKCCGFFFSQPKNPSFLDQNEVKSLPFHIPTALNRYSPAEPPVWATIGSTPPPPPHGP